MAKIEKCKCGSENLYIAPKVKGESIETASMVAIKCKDCGRWLGWCSKEDRDKYPIKIVLEGEEEPKQEQLKVETPKVEKPQPKSDKLAKAEEIRNDFLLCTKDSGIVHRAKALEFIDKIIDLLVE